MRRKAEELTRASVRFATVTIEAEFCATCLAVQGRPTRNADDGLVAESPRRLPELVLARVVRVHIRRPTTAGFFTDYYDIGLANEALGAPDKDDVTALKAAFATARSAIDSDLLNDIPEFFFLDQTVPSEWRKQYGIEVLGGACKCLLDDCSRIQWPRRYGDVVFYSPANPYKCWRAEKVGGVWKFPLQ